MPTKKIVLTLTPVEAEWLVLMLDEVLDADATGTWDTNMANALATRLDQAKLGK